MNNRIIIIIVTAEDSSVPQFGFMPPKQVSSKKSFSSVATRWSRCTAAASAGEEPLSGKRRQRKKEPWMGVMETGEQGRSSLDVYNVVNKEMCSNHLKR